jgi:hypothetical protein
MLMKQACLSTIAVASLGLLAGTSTSQAAPTGLANAATKPDAPIESVALRRCWLEDGVRHCRLIPEPYDGNFGYDDEGYYDDGPAYGYGPDIGFSFDGGGHGGHVRNR